jgi:DinB superfamily
MNERGNSRRPDELQSGSLACRGVLSMTRRPDRTEAADYYFTYIDQVPTGGICEILETQSAETLALLRAISAEQSLHRYAPDKWSIRQVISHVNDAERVFTLRALWFARGFDAALPSFDQNVAISAADADERSWASHVDEFAAVRHATLALFQHLPAHAWDRRGIASGNPFTVRALAYISAGHVTHHMTILRERYLQPD